MFFDPALQQHPRCLSPRVPILAGSSLLMAADMKGTVGAAPVGKSASLPCRILV